MTNSEIIRQYVDTGMCIPEHQVNKLSPNLLKTYLRKRIIMVSQDPQDYSFAVYEYDKMDRDTLKKAMLTGKSPSNMTVNTENFLKNLEGTTFVEKGDIHLHSCKIIPANIKFNNEGSVNLKYVDKISDGVEFNNIGDVTIERTKELSVKEFNNKGALELDYLQRFNCAVIFNNKGFVSADNIKDFKYPAVFKNDGDVDMFDVQELNENVHFENNGDVRMTTLPSLPTNFEFNNKGHVVIDAIEFSENVDYNIVFNNEGNVNMDCDFGKLPEGVIFNNNGFVRFDHIFDYSTLTEKQANAIYPKLQPHNQLRFRLKRKVMGYE